MPKEYALKRLKPGKTNQEDRMNFVRYWAEYIRTHDDKVWSRQQNILINSMMENARQLKMTPKEYLDMKGEKCFRKS